MYVVYNVVLSFPLHSPQPRHHGNALLAYSVIQELIRRDGLRIALSRRTEDELLPVVEFLVKYVSSHVALCCKCLL